MVIDFGWAVVRCDVLMDGVPDEDGINIADMIDEICV